MINKACGHNEPARAYSKEILTAKKKKKHFKMVFYSNIVLINRAFYRITIEELST